ncbi:MAG: putative zinc-binding metallopeptidase [Pseudomonadota bacterium]
MRRFSCTHCGHDLFFDSLVCVGCGRAVGFDPAARTMRTADADGAFGPLKPCDNRDIIGCNFLSDGPLCVACRHNRTIPDLSVPGHAALWTKLEAAKRVLFYSLLAWDLPRPTRAEDAAGLAFDFLADEVAADGTVTPHLTGHAAGLITINIAEGDDGERERRRTAMGEPYRTLVGHFRHEIAHFYWDRLVAPDAETLARCRAVFGDDRADYGAALARHYEDGPRADWPQHHISAYAAAHPWEDFAETFAHYTHMVDGLETAIAFGAPLVPDEAAKNPYAAGSVEALISAWIPVTVAVNAINRSMGQPDLYPFVVPPPVREKLAVIHDIIRHSVSRSGGNT